MEKGKLIVIEGTDCSGKETQSKKLIDRLNADGMKTVYYSFPRYDTPTGRIVGYPYLGKPYLAEELVKKHADAIRDKFNERFSYLRESLASEGLPELDEKTIVDFILDEIATSIATGWFPESAPNVDPKVSSLYYAADRRYNLPEMSGILERGDNIILDRYTYSSMAHQGGKLSNPYDRKALYEWIANLEFETMGLPHSDIRLFLHMPTDYATFLRQGRTEKLDENERDSNHLYNAEQAYLEIAQLYDFDSINCIRGNQEKVPTFENIKTPDEINEEVYTVVKKKLERR